MNENKPMSLKDYQAHKKNNRTSIMDVLKKIDIYNFNSGINIANTGFLFFCVITSVFYAYRISEHSSLISQIAMITIYGTFAFFEGITLLAGVSAFYCRRLVLGLVWIACWVVLAMIGYSTVTFSLDNIIRDDQHMGENQGSKISYISSEIDRLSGEFSNIDRMVATSTNNLYTKIHSELVLNGKRVVSSKSSKSYSMSEDRRWAKHCKPDVEFNVFSTDKNCAELQQRISERLKDISNHYSLQRGNLQRNINKLKRQRIGLESYRQNAFDNSGTKKLKELFNIDKNEKGKDMNVWLFGLAVIIAMWSVAMWKVFKEKDGYKFDPPEYDLIEAGKSLIAGVFYMGYVMIAPVITYFKSKAEKSEQRLLIDKHRTLTINRDLVLMSASLDSASKHIKDETVDAKVLTDIEESDRLERDRNILDALLDEDPEPKHKREEHSESAELPTPRSRIAKMLKK